MCNREMLAGVRRALLELEEEHRDLVRRRVGVHQALAHRVAPAGEHREQVQGLPVVLELRVVRLVLGPAP